MNFGGLGADDAPGPPSSPVCLVLAVHNVGPAFKCAKYPCSVIPLNIGTPTITPQGELVRWSVPTTGPDVPAELWFTVRAEFEGLLTDRTDPALVALTLAMMYRGADINVTGPATDELVYSLQGAYQQIASVTNDVPVVAITATRVLPPTARAAGVATGFSAGVDSFACIADHLLNPDVPPSLRLTHLLMNNVGSHGHGEKARMVWRKRHDSMADGVRELGLPMIAIDSNLDDFYPESIAFETSHTPRNAAIAHLLSRGIGHWFYSSGCTLWDGGAHQSRLIAHSDPFTLPLFSTSGLTLSQHGQTLTRADKTRKIADLPIAQKYLDVCMDPLATEGCNCSECNKCLRTQATLEAFGALDKFGKVFDLRLYRKRRDEYATRLLLDKTAYATDLKELLRSGRGSTRARRASIIARGRAISAARFLKWKFDERTGRVK